ncbi:MAG: TIGR02300 family protein [Alphaproteobacteria bacterium]|nr:TIGR02300 family protein [Alphaproteobacteria bacterium]
MANPLLGAKQICPNCAAKFYDLTKRPAVCPKCGTAFDPEEVLRNRRVRARVSQVEDEADEEKVVAPDVEDGFESEPDDAPELDEAVDDAPLIVDEDDADADAPPAPAADDLGVDFAEDDDLAEADDEVPFIEDGEDDDFPEDEIDGLGPEGEPEDQ